MTDLTTLDTNGAAARIGWSPKTLMNKRVDGDGPPFVKQGRSVRYRVSDLDAWQEARVRTSTSERVQA